MRPETRRKLLVISISAAVIAALIYGFLPGPVASDLAPVVRGPMTVSIEEEGKTRVKDRFIVSAPVTGYLHRIRLKVGDLLKKGQTVAMLEPVSSALLDSRTRLQAEAGITSAHAAFQAASETARIADTEASYARKNHDRQKKLFESGYISRDTFEQAETLAKSTEQNRLAAEAAVAAAKAELERARAVLHYPAAGADNASGRQAVPVRAPADGRVLKLNHESEGVVTSGEPLIETGDPGNIEVKVEVLSADAVMIKPGMQILLERWGGDKTLSGKVRRIEPEAFTKVSSLGVEEQRVLVIADITSVPAEWTGLGDEYRVEARFIIWEGKDVLQVPVSALFRKGDNWAVFVNDRGRARLKAVTAGRRNGLTAEIISGLSEGQEVIIHPGESLGDGVRIKARQKK